MSTVPPPGKRGVDGMKDYRAVTPASKPPVLPLSTQMRVAAEMAAPEIRGLAEMIGTEWQAEALRLEGAVEENERLRRAVIGAYRLLLEGEAESAEVTLGTVVSIATQGGR